MASKKIKGEVLVVVQDQNINLAGKVEKLFDPKQRENFFLPITVKGPDGEDQKWSVEIVLTPPELRE